MKQFFLISSYASTLSDLTTYTAAKAGKFGVVKEDGTLNSSNAKAVGDHVSLILNNGATMPFVMGEIALDNLKVTKTVYSAATTFKRVFTFPTPVAGDEYTVIILKKGLGFNERNKYTASIVAKTTTAATEASKLVAAINALSATCGISATVSTATITLTGVNPGDDFEVILYDGLSGVAFSTNSGDSVNGKKAVADTAWVKNLASQCAAGKGFEYTAQEGLDVYPGYPEKITATSYTIWNLMFATSRKSGKTTDELVNQVVHIAIPESSAGTAMTTLDVIFGLAEPSE